MSAITVDILGFKEWTICGVTVEYHATQDRQSMRKWKSVLEEWLPKFESANAIHDLKKIKIGENMVYFGVGGCFEKQSEVHLNVDHQIDDDIVVSDSAASVLIHEMVHHIDFRSRNVDYKSIDKSTESKLKREVSTYAGENLLEAIAEIGTGIIIGEEYPDYIHDFYAENDGPMEVYDL